MARVLKCDLCGDVYSDDIFSGSRVTIHDEHNEISHGYDLCPICTKEHLNFLPEKEKED